MEKRKLGNLEVSAIGLGCMGMSFGYPRTLTALRIINEGTRAAHASSLTDEREGR